jgi:hypothetical protein
MYRSDVALQAGGKISLTQFIISYKDLQAIAGSGAQSVNLTDADNTGSGGLPTVFLVPSATGVAVVNSTPGGGKILGVEVKEQTQFAGAFSALTISLGRTGNLTLFTAAYPLMQVPADTTLQETALFKAGGRAQFGPLVTFTPTGGNLSTATAGSVTITIAYLNVSTPTLAG